MTDENTVELNDQMLVRREKLETLREAGLDPFGKRFERDANSATLNAKYADKSKEDLHEKNSLTHIKLFFVLFFQW